MKRWGNASASNVYWYAETAENNAFTFARENHIVNFIAMYNIYEVNFLSRSGNIIYEYCIKNVDSIINYIMENHYIEGIKDLREMIIWKKLSEGDSSQQ